MTNPYGPNGSIGPNHARNLKKNEARRRAKARKRQQADTMQQLTNGLPEHLMKEAIKAINQAAAIRTLEMAVDILKKADSVNKKQEEGSADRPIIVYDSDDDVKVKPEDLD